MSTRMAVLLGVVVASGALVPSWGLAQMSPPPSNLGAPPARGSQPATPSAPPAAPAAVPRAPVQQVAPMSSPVLPQAPRSTQGGSAQGGSALGSSAPGKPSPAPAARTPVVAPKPNSAPQKQPVPARPAVGAGVAAGAAAGVAAGAAAGAAARPAEAKPAVPPVTRPAEPTKGADTGQPLPRWAGILYDGVKLRVGPGQRYPVEWIYRRPDQPVRVLREFDNWRLIEDHEGVKGWVHQSNLTGRRSFMVPSERMLRRSGSEEATAVAVLRPGVVGRVRGCAAGAAWCEVRVGEHRGWIRREGLWGISAGEAIGN
jgi:SH3-like domain-containing protein